MTFKEESDLDDKHSMITRPTSTIIMVDDNTPTAAAAAIDITKSVSEDEKHLVKEAGQGGAVLGWIVGGPLGALLLGFGSAYAIRKPKDSTMGKSSRWLAEWTLSIKQKVFKEEEKHHFVKRSKTTLDKFCGDNNNGDNNDNDTTNKNNSNSNSKSNSHTIAFKTREFIVSGWEAASNYTKENQLLERGVEETGKGIEYLTRQWDHRNKKKKASSSDNNNNNDNDNDADNNNNTTPVSSSSSEFDDDDDEPTKLVTTATNPLKKNGQIY